jgi:uncharacterized protein
MVIVNNKMLQNIPVLEVVQEVAIDKKLPLIIFIHGFTSAKEHNLHFAYLLAEKGFRVILPDAIYHGERTENLSETELSFKFWDIVINNIKELNIIKEEINQAGLLDETKIGVVGTSLGGITTLGALTQYEWINTAVSLMGSPCYQEFFNGLVHEIKRNRIELPVTEEQLLQQSSILQKYDLSVQPEKLEGRPLLFWHGERDRVVPFENTYEFYEKIYPLYDGIEENIKFISDPKSDHKVSREGLLETVEWFEKHL